MRIDANSAYRSAVVVPEINIPRISARLTYLARTVLISPENTFCIIYRQLR